MTNCTECKYYRVYRGTRDRYGVPQEPDDAECVCENVTDHDIETYFCNGKSWDNTEEGAGCTGYESRGYPRF